MQITLSKFGPAFWFLGNPHNLTVSLTQKNPGPVNVNVNKLTDAEKFKLLCGINNKDIETTEDIKELYTQRQQVEPARNNTFSKQVDFMKKVLQRKQENEYKREQLSKQQENRCELFLKSSLVGIRSAIKNETDIGYLKKILESERVHRNRKTIIDYLLKKINYLTTERQRKLEAKVRRDTAKQLRNLKKETSSFSVVESEQEVVVLSTDDLIHSAL